jgi:hypothetical protein
MIPNKSTSIKNFKIQSSVDTIHSPLDVVKVVKDYFFDFVVRYSGFPISASLCLKMDHEQDHEQKSVL